MAKIYERFCTRERKWLAVMYRGHLAFNVLYRKISKLLKLKFAAALYF